MTDALAFETAPAARQKLPEKMSVRNLDFFYGDNRALKSVNVPLYTNHATAFIGPSGCGKSTSTWPRSRRRDGPTGFSAPSLNLGYHLPANRGDDGA